MPKYASFRHCILKKTQLQHPPVSFITHKVHSIHNQSPKPVIILSRTALHTTDQVLWRDLASHTISPLTNLLFLEQPHDLARSRPIGVPKKIRQHPLDKMCLLIRFSASNIFICGVGCLSQGKEGQKRKIEVKREP